LDPTHNFPVAQAICKKFSYKNFHLDRRLHVEDNPPVLDSREIPTPIGSRAGPRFTTLRMRGTFP
jgi:hypothetical protein